MTKPRIALLVVFSILTAMGVYGSYVYAMRGDYHSMWFVGSTQTITGISVILLTVWRAKRHQQ